MNKKMKSIKCAQCELVNWATADVCKRCGAALNVEDETNFRNHKLESSFSKDKVKTSSTGFIKRASIVVGIIAFFLFGSYVSLLVSSEPLTFEQRQTVWRATNVLERDGFTREAFVFNHLVGFRATDNWWNRWVGHGGAYAATNFPFETVTLYPDFFKVPVDDNERALVLLHESFHLRGKGEPEAHAGVWKLKSKLNWTQDKYGQTNLWKNVREDTLTYAPQLFQCGLESNKDCTE